MHEYTRKVFYYETDRMGVVHHSNFVRWLEEARVDFLAAIGLPFEQVEADGILVPVIGLSVRFRQFARFGDTFTVRLHIAKYTGARMVVAYTVVNQNGDVVLEGESEHTFVDANFRLAPLKKKLPHAHELMKQLSETEA